MTGGQKTFLAGLEAEVVVVVGGGRRGLSRKSPGPCCSSGMLRSKHTAHSYILSNISMDINQAKCEPIGKGSISGYKIREQLLECLDFSVDILVFR